MVNAVRHSGAPSVSVYLEVEPQTVSIFVRDRGTGFDIAAVAPDRRGISGSIVDRLERAGGSAQVRTAPGAGTEVEMSLPRAPERRTEIQAEIPDARTAGDRRVGDRGPDGPSRSDEVAP
jgi:signal transduction histidine kinase